MNKNTVKIVTIFILGITINNCSSPATTPNNTGTSTATSASDKFKVLKTISVGVTPHGMGAASGFVYNSNTGDGTISVINSSKDEIDKTITLDNDGVPGYIKAFHDGKNILIGDSKNGNLMVIDPLQDHEIIQTIFVGQTPDKIKISEDDKTVFVSLVGESKVISLTFGSDRTKAPEKKEYKIGTMTQGSEDRSIDAENNWVLVPNIADNDVSLINTDTGIEKRLKDGNNPAVVQLGLVNDQPKVAIVGNTSSNTVTLFDLASDNKKTLSDVGLAPTDSVIVDELNRVFITMAGSNEVGVIDYDKQTFVGKIPVGSRPVHIYLAPALATTKALSIKHDDTGTASNELWVANDGGDSVTIIDAATLAVKGTVKVGKGHHKMAFLDSKVYVSNITDNTITVIQRM